MSHRGFRLDPSTPLADRVLYYVAADVNTRCWEWLGSITTSTGYGQMTFAGKVHKAHRVAYEAFVGPIPAGLQIDHLCRNRRCVNPTHLEPVTAQVNNLRGNSPGAISRRRTHCAVGHDFEVHGAVRRGRRICRTCRIAYLQAYRLRKQLRPAA